MSGSSTPSSICHSARPQLHEPRSDMDGTNTRWMESTVDKLLLYRALCGTDMRWCGPRARKPLREYRIAFLACRFNSPPAWFNPAAFTTPQPGHFGNAGVDAIEGQGLLSTNVSRNKTFVTERVHFLLTVPLPTSSTVPVSTTSIRISLIRRRDNTTTSPLIMLVIVPVDE
jgi:hypothetical protein